MKDILYRDDNGRKSWPFYTELLCCDWLSLVIGQLLSNWKLREDM